MTFLGLGGPYLEQLFHDVEKHEKDKRYLSLVTSIEQYVDGIQQYQLNRNVVHHFLVLLQEAEHELLIAQKKEEEQQQYRKHVYPHLVQTRNKLQLIVERLEKVAKNFMSVQRKKRQTGQAKRSLQYILAELHKTKPERLSSALDRVFQRLHISVQLLREKKLSEAREQAIRATSELYKIIEQLKAIKDML